MLKSKEKDKNAEMLIPHMQRRQFLGTSGSFVGTSLLAGCTTFGDTNGNTNNQVDPAVITSSGGNLSLTIPNDAFPQGTNADDVAIEPYGPDEMPFSLRNDNLTSYRLEPDGLEFEKPITVTVDVSGDEPVVPLLLHFDDESIEAVQNTSVSISRDPSGTYSVQASTEIEHFSGFAESTDGLFRVTTSTPATELRQFHVGEEIPFTFIVEPSEKVFLVEDQDGKEIATMSVVEDSRYQVNDDDEDHRFRDKNSRLQPDTPLPADDLAYDETYRINNKIECTFSGKGSYLALSVLIDYRQWFYSYLTDIDTEKDAFITVLYQTDYTCLRAEQTDDDQPTDTDQPTDDSARRTVSAIKYGDAFIPLSELKIDSGNECSGVKHYHPGEGNSAEAIDGSTIPDPAPSGCGYGTVTDTQIRIVPAPESTTTTPG